MARPLPSEPQVTGDSKPSVPESSNPPSTMDGSKKKKKKSRKSKHKERSSPEANTNSVESSAQQDAESPRPSKRKHESKHEHKKKKKKKKHHAAENDVKGASIPVSETGQNQTAPSQSENPASQEPPKPAQSTVDEAHVTAPSSQAESVGYETNGELNGKGRPKKQRGSRLGGKDNLKVGFFVPEEIERLEKFKLDFCNTHRLSGEQFDMMVQHSEREGGEFPCPSSITSKAEFWSDIYRIISDRDRRSVYRFMRRHFQVTTQKPHEWTDDQDEELVQLHAEHGPKWVFIAKLLGRSDDDVTQRWKNKLEHRNTMRRGPWGADELRTFMEAMQQIWEGYRQLLHEGAGNDVYEMDEKLVGWGGVSNTMKNVRSRQQCADKWRKVRRAVMAKRATGFPDAVFDYTKAVKKRAQPTEEPSSTKSNEFVVEDEDDEEDDGNVGDNSLPTSAATTPAPKSGFADKQHMIALAAKAAKPSAESPSSEQPETETNAELEPKSNGMSEKKARETPGNADETASPGIPATPVSASGPQKPDTGRMAQIKEKIKEANKSSASKKRKRTEDETPDEAVAEPEQPSIADRQSEKERKKEKKRKKKERKAQEEREGIEAEVEAAKAVTQQAAESEKKAKKHKKRKSTDTADVVDAIASATPDKKKKKKKHRNSEAEGEANGAQAEDAEASEPPRKKDKKEKAKKKQAAQEASDVTEQQPYESPVPVPAVDQKQAEFDPDDSSDDNSIKLEGTESD